MPSSATLAERMLESITLVQVLPEVFRGSAELEPAEEAAFKRQMQQRKHSQQAGKREASVAGIGFESTL